MFYACLSGLSTQRNGCAGTPASPLPLLGVAWSLPFVVSFARLRAYYLARSYVPLAARHSPNGSFGHSCVFWLGMRLRWSSVEAGILKFYEDIEVTTFLDEQEPTEFEGPLRFDAWSRWIGETVMEPHVYVDQTWSSWIAVNGCEDREGASPTRIDESMIPRASISIPANPTRFGLSALDNNLHLAENEDKELEPFDFLIDRERVKMSRSYNSFGRRWRADGICTRELNGHFDQVTFICKVNPKVVSGLNRIVTYAAKDRTIRLKKFVAKDKVVYAPMFVHEDKDILEGDEKLCVSDRVDRHRANRRSLYQLLANKNSCSQPRWT
ncbi:ribosome biogenesis protein WDR12 homolog [Striga asiatica]|uniref:Ribosome biogenesis protein WDR12 homolog n=1 Tax=Striga asiatica TaxID=4170 RepID=A0A5A7P2F0_STRAF|nr:ribosome biogenesis protein WDR12 homolog [Striga asiatica]